MKTEGTNLLLLQFLPSGAHLGGPWPPRWAPQGREVSHWAVVIDRFHCSWTDAAWLTCRTQPESQQARMTHCHHGAVLGGQIQLPEVLIHNIAMALWGVIVPAIVNVKPKVPINQDQHLRKEMATIHDIATPMMIMSKTVVSPVCQPGRCATDLHKANKMILTHILLNSTRPGWSDVCRSPLV